MLTKRQFLALYDETVLSIRQIKNNNDKINKSIGVLNEMSLHRQTEAQKQMVEDLFKKVNQLVQKMEKNYLDPDTARKIGVVKQQLRIQKDRREQLLQNVDQITKQYKNKQKQEQKREQIMTANNNKKNNSVNRTSSIEMESGEYNYYKRSQLTDIGDESTEGDHQKTQVPMQMSDHDFQIERKLIHQKNQHLINAHERMINIKNIVSQTSDLAYAQGQKLDIIGDDLFKTYKNVTLSNTQLQQANQQHRKSRKKIMALSLLILLIIGAVLFFIFGM